MKKILNKYLKWNPPILAKIAILLIPFFTFSMLKFGLDNDFWFIINIGKTLLQNGFINVETFTLHADLFFVPQQWLTSIIFYILYSKFDIMGIFLLLFIINIFIVIIIYKTCKVVGNNSLNATIITVIVDIIIITGGVFVTRPQIFDLVLLLLEILLLELYIKNNKSRYLFVLPIISVLLINLHSSTWLMMFVFLLPYYVEWFAERVIKKENVYNFKPIIFTTIISFLCGFINPYGIDSIMYLFGSYGISEINQFVGEMKPINIGSCMGCFILICLLLLTFYKNKGNNKTRFVLFFLGTTFLMLNHFKGALYFLAILPVVVSYNFSRNEAYISEISILEKIIYILLIMFLLIFIFNGSLHGKKSYDNNHYNEAVEYLEKNANHNIKLYTGYNDGAYMEYVGYKCYIDARAEVFLKVNNKKDDIFKEYYKLQVNEIDRYEFVNKYDFDYIFVSDSDVLYDIDKYSNNYEIVYKYESYNEIVNRIIKYKIFKKIN